MGTRNVTSVFVNGKQVVCQYGQWDGYPTWTGAKVLKFMRDADIKQFKRALENTKITVVNYEQAATYTGSTKEVSEIYDKVWETQSTLNKNKQPDDEYYGTYKTVQRMYDEGNLTAQEVDDYLVSTRDTGCDILPFIYERSLDVEPLELFAMTEEFNGEYAWDIQGIYIIDLDKKLIKMTFNGYSKEYELDKLPTNIDKEMIIFEKIIYALNDVDFNNKHQNMKTLFVKAKEIALAIGNAIKEEYPQLIDNKDEPLCAEDFGQEYLYKTLCEKQLESWKSVENIVTDAIAKSQPVPDENKCGLNFEEIESL